MFRFAIVVSRFNEEITEGLLRGAQEFFAERSIPSDAVKVFRVPGAFEIPLAAKRLGESGEFDAIVCLGCLIKGDTMHFEYIADATSHGIMRAAASTGLPMAFGVLTTDTWEQAEERAVDGQENKGWEAAAAAIEMAGMVRTLRTGDRVRTGR